jgi:hypothetical protein
MDTWVKVPAVVEYHNKSEFSNSPHRRLRGIRSGSAFYGSYNLFETLLSVCCTILLNGEMELGNVIL